MVVDFSAGIVQLKERSDDMNNTHLLKYVRIQGRETAYRTGKPVGIFATVWRLDQAGVLTDDEKAV